MQRITFRTARTATSLARTFFVVLLFALVCAVPQRSFAQGANPLELGNQAVPSLLGVVIGPSFHSQIGKFDTGCPCTFENGGGTGIALGLTYDRNLLIYGNNAKGQLWLGGRLMYEARNITAVFREYEVVQVQSVAVRDQFFRVPIQFRHQAQAQFGLITFTPYVQWNPWGDIFAQIGLQGGFVVNSRIIHDKQLLDQTVTLPNGERAAVSYAQADSLSTSTTVTVENGPAARVNGFQLGLTATVGIDIPIALGRGGENKQFRLTPMLNYVLPLTNMTERDRSVQPDGADPLRISAFQILIAMKMNLN
jgi:hypothetical protein